MSTAHQIPVALKGATHISVTEVVISTRRETILVRADLGVIEEEVFVPDSDLAERVVVLDGERYSAVFGRGATRGLPVGDFGRQDLLAECDAKGW